MYTYDINFSSTFRKGFKFFEDLKLGLSTILKFKYKLDHDGSLLLTILLPSQNEIVRPPNKVLDPRVMSLIRQDMKNLAGKNIKLLIRDAQPLIIDSGLKIFDESQLTNFLEIRKKMIYSNIE